MQAAIPDLCIADEFCLPHIGKPFSEISGDSTVTTAPGAPEGILLSGQEKSDTIVPGYPMPDRQYIVNGVGFDQYVARWQQPDPDDRFLKTDDRRIVMS